MELATEEFPTCVAVSNGGRFVLGSVDGSIRMATFNLSEEVVDYGWQFNMKAPIRKVIFNQDGTQVLSICRNKAVCSYDVETGVRTRCIMEGTKGIPTSICLVPPTAPKYQFATGCEKGQVCTWDFRASEAKICTWKEQAEDINALAMDTRHCMLSASSDGTLAAFDMRKRKLRMKSEVMGSELLSICVSDKYVYAGGSDGYLEIFNLGEYGNIVGRTESGFDVSVSDVVELRRGLLLTSCESSNCLRLLNVQPNKKLGILRKHGAEDVGVDTIAVSPDRSTLISMSSISSSLMLWPLAEILEGIPVLRADKIEKRKQPSKEDFFDDLVDSHKKRKTGGSDDDVEDDSDEEEDEEDEEEEEADSDEDSAAVCKRTVQENDEDEDDNIDEEEEVAAKENKVTAAPGDHSDDEIDEEEELDEEEEEAAPNTASKVTVVAVDDIDEESHDDEEDEEMEEEIEAAVRRKVPVPTVEDDSEEELDDEEIDEEEEEEEHPQTPLKAKTPPPKPKTPQSVKRSVKPKTPQSARKMARKLAAGVGKGRPTVTQQAKGKPRWKY